MNLNLARLQGQAIRVLHEVVGYSDRSATLIAVNVIKKMSHRPQGHAASASDSGR